MCCIFASSTVSTVLSIILFIITKARPRPLPAPTVRKSVTQFNKYCQAPPRLVIMPALSDSVDIDLNHWLHNNHQEDLQDLIALLQRWKEGQVAFTTHAQCEHVP